MKNETADIKEEIKDIEDIEKKKSRKKPPFTPEEQYKEKIKRGHIRQFQRKQHEFLLISIFNAKTAEENKIYRNTNPKMALLKNGACYCSPIQIKHTIPYESICYVFEMYNHINKIGAIGRIKAKPRSETHNVYDDKNYHRHYYLGKYRIPREEMTEKEEEIMKILDILCFKGNTHMKRNQGLKSFPNRILYDLKETPDDIFLKNKYLKPLVEKGEIKNEPIDLLKKIQEMFSTRNYI